MVLSCYYHLGDAILTAPGQRFEMETQLIGTSAQKVFKNLSPSLRTFWLSHSDVHASSTYVVFESDRLTYHDARARSFRAASVLREVYGVRKGDRVAIAMRNFPEYLVAFWAIHLLGAISVAINAWLPEKELYYCIAHTDSKVAILDPERADILRNRIWDLKREAGATGVLVVRAHESRSGSWDGMELWDKVMGQYKGKDDSAWQKEPKCAPDDDCTIFYTSGT